MLSRGELTRGAIDWMWRTYLAMCDSADEELFNLHHSEHLIAEAGTDE